MHLNKLSTIADEIELFIKRIAGNDSNTKGIDQHVRLRILGHLMLIARRPIVMLGINVKI